MKYFILFLYFIDLYGGLVTKNFGNKNSQTFKTVATQGPVYHFSHCADEYSINKKWTAATHKPAQTEWPMFIGIENNENGKQNWVTIK